MLLGLCPNYRRTEALEADGVVMRANPCAYYDNQSNYVKIYLLATRRFSPLWHLRSLRSICCDITLKAFSTGSRQVVQVPSTHASTLQRITASTDTGRFERNLDFGAKLLTPGAHASLGYASESGTLVKSGPGKLIATAIIAEHTHRQDTTTGQIDRREMRYGVERRPFGLDLEGVVRSRVISRGCRLVFSRLEWRM